MARRDRETTDPTGETTGTATAWIADGTRWTRTAGLEHDEPTQPSPDEDGIDELPLPPPLPPELPPPRAPPRATPRAPPARVGETTVRVPPPPPPRVETRHKRRRRSQVQWTAAKSGLAGLLSAAAIAAVVLVVLLVYSLAT